MTFFPRLFANLGGQRGVFCLPAAALSKYGDVPGLSISSVFRMNLNVIRSTAAIGPCLLPIRLMTDNKPDGDAGDTFRAPNPVNVSDELPYKVELWDAAKQTVEQVLAVTAHASIGYAAYYAAARDYPDRYITLRLKNRTIARSDGPSN